MLKYKLHRTVCQLKTNVAEKYILIDISDFSY